MLTNNDVIRRLRYAFDLSDQNMVDIFKEADFEASLNDVIAWTKKDEAPGFKELSNTELIAFLDGFINLKRGKKEGYEFVATPYIDNNLIFRKIRIGLNLRDDEILKIMDLSGKTLGKSELSAFFRKPEHKHYRLCKDQVLRNFLKGLAIWQGKK
jgi:uncharacterized protein YehS (DUF1456 family)